LFCEFKNLTLIIFFFNCTILFYN